MCPPVATFSSGLTASPLFGQALYAVQPGRLYIDAAGNGLSFTGSSSALESFSMGSMIHASSQAFVWGIIKVHGFSADYGDYLQDRIGIVVWDSKPTFSYLDEGCSFRYYIYANSAVRLSGWFHFGVTYEKLTAEDNLKIYINGTLWNSATLPNLKVCGSSGGYDLYCETECCFQRDTRTVLNQNDFCIFCILFKNFLQVINLWRKSELQLLLSEDNVLFSGL